MVPILASLSDFQSHSLLLQASFSAIFRSFVQHFSAAADV